MRNMILAATIAVVAIAPETAQTAIGDWRGTLTPAPGTTLRIAIQIQKAQEGSGLVGTLDSLDQGAMGIGLAAIAPVGDRLTFTVPSIGGKYDGKWAAVRGNWVGTFTQGPLRMALTLSPHTTAPSTPLALPANWKIDPATATPLLDTLVAGRAGISATVGLVDRNRIDVRTSTGANADALYEIGSITKLFTALLLADMAAKGEVKLDDPVAKYLPVDSLPANGNRPITLRDLAGHYSGLPRLPSNLSFKDMSDPYADFDEASLLAILKGWKPSRPPGTMFEYSNLGAGLLGYALGRAGGKPYDQLLGDRILRPLGMSSTRVAIGAGDAVPHGADGKPVKPWNLAILVAAGGLRSTAGDMAKFTRVLVDPPAAMKPAVAMLLRDVRPGGGTQTKIGLGLFTRTTTAGFIAFHDGRTGGSRSSLVIEQARKRGAIVLINSAAEPGPGPLSLHFATGRALPNKP